MPRYVLSTQTLIHLALKQNLPAELWLEGATARGVYSSDLFISAATPARITLVIRQWRQKVAEGTSPPGVNEDYLSILERNAVQIISIIRNGGRLIPADEAILSRWANLLADPGMTRTVDGEDKKIESIELLEIATAATGYQGRAYRLLAQDEPHLQRVNGLTVEDPATQNTTTKTGP